MKFASGMVVKATISELRIVEVATVSAMAVPLPGRGDFSRRTTGTLMLFTGDVVLGGIQFAEHTMVITAAAINVGFEAICSG
jgi:hypothetical protein